MYIHLSQNPKPLFQPHKKQTGWMEQQQSIHWTGGGRKKIGFCFCFVFLRDKPSQATKKGRKLKRRAGEHCRTRYSSEKIGDQRQTTSPGSTRKGKQTQIGTCMIILRQNGGKWRGRAGKNSFFLFFVSTHRVVSKDKIASKREKCSRIRSIVRSKKENKQWEQLHSFFCSEKNFPTTRAFLSRNPPAFCFFVGKRESHRNGWHDASIRRWRDKHAYWDDKISESNVCSPRNAGQNV